MKGCVLRQNMKILPFIDVKNAGILFLRFE